MPSRLSLFDASGTPRLHGLRASSNVLGEHIRSADCRIATVHPSGASASEIQHILGHESLNTSQTYIDAPRPTSNERPSNRTYRALGQIAKDM